MAQLVEHILGKDEVPGPNPGSSSRQPRRFYLRGFGFFIAFSGCYPVRRRGKIRAMRLILKSPPGSSQSESRCRSRPPEGYFSGLWFFIATEWISRLYQAWGLSGAVSQYQPKSDAPKVRKSALFLENSFAKSALCFTHFQKISSDFRVFR